MLYIDPDRPGTGPPLRAGLGIDPRAALEAIEDDRARCCPDRPERRRADLDPDAPLRRAAE